MYPTLPLPTCRTLSNTSIPPEDLCVTAFRSDAEIQQTWVKFIGGFSICRGACPNFGKFFRSTNALVEDIEHKPLSEKVIILALCSIIKVLSDFHQTKFVLATFRLLSCNNRTSIIEHKLSLLGCHFSKHSSNFPLNFPTNIYHTCS